MRPLRTNGKTVGTGGKTGLFGLSRMLKNLLLTRLLKRVQVQGGARRAE